MVSTVARLGKTRLVLATACIYLVVGCGGSSSSGAAPPPPITPVARPNIIVILTDDQGYADVGYQNAVGFTTPNIDWMAANGMRFTDFYMAASVCTPARAALLTGCYPQRVGLPWVVFPKSKIGLNPDETTVAEILKARGYATALFGKWHVGDDPDFLPENHGFDEWFGIPYSNDMRPESTGTGDPAFYPPLPLMRSTKVIETDPDQSKLTRRYTEEALRFIRQEKDRPFFLFLSHTFPHIPLFASKNFKGRTQRGLYGDVIEELDWSVGQVLAELDRLDIADNTLVIFTSDNGPWLIKGDDGGSAGPLREGKVTSFEGGHRVPCVMYWPGKIPAKSECKTMVTAMDLLPTITKLSGGTLPASKIDGRDVSRLLQGDTISGAEAHPLFYYFYAQLQAVRVGRYKLHVPHDYGSIHGAQLARPGFPGQPKIRKIGLSLFDLETDIGETNDIAARQPDVVKKLLALCEQARTDLGDIGKKGAGVRPPGRVK